MDEPSQSNGLEHIRSRLEKKLGLLIGSLHSVIVLPSQSTHIHTIESIHRKGSLSKGENDKEDVQGEVCRTESDYSSKESFSANRFRLDQEVSDIFQTAYAFLQNLRDVSHERQLCADRAELLRTVTKRLDTEREELRIQLRDMKAIALEREETMKHTYERRVADLTKQVLIMKGTVERVLRDTAFSTKDMKNGYEEQLKGCRDEAKARQEILTMTHQEEHSRWHVGMEEEHVRERIVLCRDWERIIHETQNAAIQERLQLKTQHEEEEQAWMRNHRNEVYALQSSSEALVAQLGLEHDWHDEFSHYVFESFSILFAETTKKVSKNWEQHQTTLSQVSQTKNMYQDFLSINVTGWCGELWNQLECFFFAKWEATFSAASGHCSHATGAFRVEIEEVNERSAHTANHFEALFETVLEQQCILQEILRKRLDLISVESSVTFDSLQRTMSQSRDELQRRLLEKDASFHVLKNSLADSQRVQRQLSASLEAQQKYFHEFIDTSFCTLLELEEHGRSRITGCMVEWVTGTHAMMRKSLSINSRCHARVEHGNAELVTARQILYEERRHHNNITEKLMTRWLIGHEALLLERTSAVTEIIKDSIAVKLWGECKLEMERVKLDHLKEEEERERREVFKHQETACHWMQLYKDETLRITELESQLVLAKEVLDTERCAHAEQLRDIERQMQNVRVGQLEQLEREYDVCLRNQYKALQQVHDQQLQEVLAAHHSAKEREEANLKERYEKEYVMLREECDVLIQQVQEKEHEISTLRDRMEKTQMQWVNDFEEQKRIHDKDAQASITAIIGTHQCNVERIHNQYNHLLNTMMEYVNTRLVSDSSGSDMNPIQCLLLIVADFLLTEGASGLTNTLKNTLLLQHQHTIEHMQKTTDECLALSRRNASSELASIHSQFKTEYETREISFAAELARISQELQIAHEEIAELQSKGVVQENQVALLREQTHRDREALLRARSNLQLAQEESRQQQKARELAFQTERAALRQQHADSLAQVQENLKADANLMKAELEDQIHSLNVKLKERPSRQDDLDVIQSLKDECRRKDTILLELQREKTAYQLELTNREDSYNKVFNRPSPILSSMPSTRGNITAQQSNGWVSESMRLPPKSHSTTPASKTTALDVKTRIGLVHSGQSPVPSSTETQNANNLSMQHVSNNAPNTIALSNSNIRRANTSLILKQYNNN